MLIETASEVKVAGEVGSIFVSENITLVVADVSAIDDTTEIDEIIEVDEIRVSDDC